ncbi:hypothetical protein DRO64_07570 [Candidatus Bathyarchaeota archaeon]|nr:MAG: hypothetical protein DRO64_07570 [Candidatus Bathyarchaeota archaeon]
MPSSTKMAAVSAIFGALVLAMELAGLSHFLPFPPLSYLLYDPAEIPVYFLYLAMGLRAALLSTAIVVLGLSINIDNFSLLIMSCTGIPFFGPMMKGAAIASTLFGLYLGKRLKGGWVSSLTLGLASRAVFMTFPNLLFIIYIVPKLPLPEQIIGWFTLNIQYILTLTACYNVSQTLIGVIPAKLLYRIISRRAPQYLKRIA